MSSLLLLLLLGTLLTGCVAMDYHLVINEDGTGQIQIKMLVDEQMLALADDTNGAEDLRKDAEKNGFTTEALNDKGMTGFTAVSKTLPLDELRPHKSLTGANGTKPFLYQKGWYRSTYQLDAVFDLSDLGSQDHNEMERVFTSKMDMKFRISIPGDITEHNATTKDGGTLAWQLEPGKKNPLHATSVSWHWGNIAVTALGLLGIVGGCTYYWLGVNRRRRETAATETLAANSLPVELTPTREPKPSVIHRRLMIYAGAGVVLLAFAIYWVTAYSKARGLYGEAEAALRRNDWNRAFDRFEAGNKTAPVLAPKEDARTKVGHARQAKAQEDLAKVKASVTENNFKGARVHIGEMPAEEGDLIQEAERAYEEGAVALVAEGKALLGKGEFDKVNGIVKQIPQDAKSAATDSEMLKKAYSALAPESANLSDLLPYGVHEEGRKFVRTNAATPPLLAVNWKRGFADSNTSLLSYDGASLTWKLEGIGFDTGCYSTNTLEGSFVADQKHLVLYAYCGGIRPNTEVKIFGSKDGKLAKVYETAYFGSAKVTGDGATLVLKGGDNETVISWNGASFEKSPRDVQMKAPAGVTIITYRTAEGGKVTAPAKVTVRVGEKFAFVRDGSGLSESIMVPGGDFYRNTNESFTFLAVSPGSGIFVIQPRIDIFGRDSQVKVQLEVVR